MIKINVYRDGKEWYGARWIDGEYDGCDSLDISDGASEAAAIAAAKSVPLSAPGARIVARVDDIDTRGEDYIGRGAVELLAGDQS